MNISDQGLMEILSHEGICLSPYLDSVGVWTIGVGITKYDGKDPRDFGTITLEQAISMFRDRLKAYVLPVQKLPLKLNQHQFDALVSLCFNFGPENLAKLVANRSLEEIGEAIMLYTKPREITERRRKEQALFKYGKYSNTGKGTVFPVSATGRPIYSKGYQVDLAKVLGLKPASKPATDAGIIVATTIATTAGIASTAPGVPWWAIAVAVGAAAIGFVIWKVSKRDKQVHKLNGEPALEGAVLRGDGRGQDRSPVHSEEPGPSRLPVLVPPVHGSERSD